MCAACRDELVCCQRVEQLPARFRPGQMETRLPFRKCVVIPADCMPDSDYGKQVCVTLNCPHLHAGTPAVPPPATCDGLWPAGGNTWPHTRHQGEAHVEQPGYSIIGMTVPMSNNETIPACIVPWTRTVLGIITVRCHDGVCFWFLCL